MKTEQEQIEEMAVIGCVRNPQAHTAEECSKCDFKQGMCNAYRHAEALYNAGYGDVSEYKAEIERLHSNTPQHLKDLLIEFDEMGFAPTTVCPNPDKYATEWRDRLVNCVNDATKQAQTDVLNELKNKTHNYYPSIDSYCVSQHVVLVKDIDKMMRALKNVD